MISRTTLETMKVICNRKDECTHFTCPHYREHERSYGANEYLMCCEDVCRCDEVEGRVECIQADPIKFELIS